ncbi:hypothetical protein K443DRAFT_8271 [Laccaria amethystina LaAM-08-1]|uniref:Peptidase A1 domain-containing protein n=1 Tax=Laccaria amethystina LaAM-08-1 TaxID=1095629 RepID=A0A0C9XUM3_9AGAR|nr:hypothetical protein K443DRAFT_8271 [Laccaria amethystina LaAM-08-1]
MSLTRVGLTVVPNQSTGVARTLTLGLRFPIGSVDPPIGRLSPTTGSSIPTVTDNLSGDGVITANEIGVSLEPTPQANVMNGELAWGLARSCGTDGSKFTGSINLTPITTTSPANKFWGINQHIHYGGSTTILSSIPGIVDTGTTIVLIANDGHTRYKYATGAVAAVPRASSVSPKLSSRTYRVCSSPRLRRTYSLLAPKSLGTEH